MSDKVLCRTIVLVGKTGNGKSALGNKLLGRTQFKSAAGADGVTKTIETAECKHKTALTNLELTIIDTPGLFDCSDVSKTSFELKKVVEKKPHVFLLVLKEGRFTEDEKYTVDLLNIIFGDHVFRHTIVVVTHGRNFINDEAWDKFKNSENVAPLINLCGNRIIKSEIHTPTQERELFQFCQYLADIDTVYRNEYEEIHSDVIAKYCKKEHGGTIKRKKLEKILNEIEYKKTFERGFKQSTEEMKTILDQKTNTLKNELKKDIQDFKEDVTETVLEEINRSKSIFKSCCS